MLQLVFLESSSYNAENTLKYEKQYPRGLPDCTEQFLLSALVDGANHWQTYWQLIFPLVRPILIVVGILSFVGTFNEFILARVLLRDKESWTLMVCVAPAVRMMFSRANFWNPATWNVSE